MDKDFYNKFKGVDMNVLLSFIAEGLVVFDDEGRIVILNPHASLLLDYTAGELTGKRVDDMIPSYLGKKMIEADKRIAATVKRGETFSVPIDQTLYFENQNGIRFPVFASAKPISLHSEGGDVSGGVLVFRDITVEKELEKAKEHTAETLSHLTPILQKTATGDFTHYPELPKEEDEFTELLVGLRLMLDDLRELDLARERNEQEKIFAVEEKRALTEKYSKELELEVERKTRELSAAKRHIETIIESLTDALIEYDNDFRVVRLNDSAEKMLGVKKGEIIGKRVSREDIFERSLSALVQITFPELSEKSKHVSPDVSGIEADICELPVTYPIERDVQIITVPVSMEDGTARAGILKMVRDVTREKLVSRSKSEFIAIAAHQLRTPLSAIKWALNLLQKGDFGKLNEEQVGVITDAFDTNEKMINLVNDLLNVARIEDGRFGYEFTKNDFHNLVAKTTSLSVSRANQKGVELIFTDKLQSPKEFVFDYNKISMAIQNLVDNAIKYTNSGGKVEVILDMSGDYVRVEVLDTGVGVPQHQIDRLFTKFFRAENVTTLPFSGSGLGLFITRNIIVRHGGEIAVESKEGKGTKFSFIIPTDESLIPAKDDIAASLYV